MPVNRSLKLGFTAYLLVMASMVLPTHEVWAQSTYLFGKQGWFAIGDTLQFMGDSYVGSPGYDDCPWDDGCEIDSGFTLRKVMDVDLENCTADELPSDTCYVCAVVCCFFMGDCDSSPCGEGEVECWETEEECGNYCFCKALFVVTAYNSSPGDLELGCYTVDLLCDSDEACENGLSGCDVVQKWFVP